MASALTAFLIAVLGAVAVGWNALQGVLFLTMAPIIFVSLRTLIRFRRMAQARLIGLASIVGLATAHLIYESTPLFQSFDLAAFRIPSAFQWFLQFTVLTVLLLWRSQGFMARSKDRQA